MRPTGNGEADRATAYAVPTEVLYLVIILWEYLRVFPSSEESPLAKRIILKPSRTLAEFRLLPGLTTAASTLDKISLETTLAVHPETGATLSLGIPVMASAMQSVAGSRMGIAMARLGGAAAIFSSQATASQADMVRAIKGDPQEQTQDIDDDPHRKPQSMVDDRGRPFALAAINTHDFRDRVPSLAAAGVDALVIDASDGYSIFQEATLDFVSERYRDLPVIAGNIITDDAFDYLADHGAWAVKVGMGGGSICITQEQKGTGRGLASALIDVCERRDRYHEGTGRYVPIIADGGIFTAKDIVIALAIGADSVMMGRYFARMEESPTEKVTVGGRPMKAYWGEGSGRAREWREARYSQLQFAEGVEGCIPYAGKVADSLDITLSKIKASMSSCGCATIAELHDRAELEIVSALSIREGDVHDIHAPATSSGSEMETAWAKGHDTR
ncbi:MAG: IMP dehydrogenase [Deltaproteobacteria bacterium]|nr:IMP dehydrogenase [Deltaproteobacteria bacterium]